MDISVQLFFVFLISIAMLSFGKSLESPVANFVKEERIVGESAFRFEVVSSMECSSRCLTDLGCKAVQYRQQNSIENCILIHGFASRENTTFVSNKQNQIFRKVHEVWIRPMNWDSSDFPALYRSFDSDRYLHLENGAQIVVGKVFSAVRTDLSNDQSVSLGDASAHACLSIPESCGSAGGALSLWIKIEDCNGDGGIISSCHNFEQGFVMRCWNNHGLRILYVISLPDGIFVANRNQISSGWFHVVINFVGPSDGEGIVVYYDGAQRAMNQYKQGNTYEAGSGEVVIGKYNDIYSSLMMDELLFFNRKLSLKEIEILYNMDE